MVAAAPLTSTPPHFALQPTGRHDDGGCGVWLAETSCGQCDVVIWVPRDCLGHAVPMTCPTCDPSYRRTQDAAQPQT